jgi:hypothetical protein
VCVDYAILPNTVEEITVWVLAHSGLPGTVLSRMNAPEDTFENAQILLAWVNYVYYNKLASVTRYVSHPFTLHKVERAVITTFSYVPTEVAGVRVI